jgi:hypothetical protein
MVPGSIPGGRTSAKEKQQFLRTAAFLLARDLRHVRRWSEAEHVRSALPSATNSEPGSRTLSRFGVEDEQIYLVIREDRTISGIRRFFNCPPKKCACAHFGQGSNAGAMFLARFLAREMSEACPAALMSVSELVTVRTIPI